MSSNVIRKVAYARENGFYKIEQARPHKAQGSGWVLPPRPPCGLEPVRGRVQEADLQKHRKRLIAQGRLEELAGSFLKPKRSKTFKESAEAFEVLPSSK